MTRPLTSLEALDALIQSKQQTDYDELMQEVRQAAVAAVSNAMKRGEHDFGEQENKLVDEFVAKMMPKAPAPIPANKFDINDDGRVPDALCPPHRFPAAGASCSVCGYPDWSGAQ